MAVWIWSNVIAVFTKYGFPKGISLELGLVISSIAPPISIVQIHRGPTSAILFILYTASTVTTVIAGSLVTRKVKSEEVVETRKHIQQGYPQEKPSDTQSVNVSNQPNSHTSDFRRMEGLVGSVPQRFADTHIPLCPMCKSSTPRWTVNERLGKLMSFDPEENAHKYLFRCEECGCVLRVPVTDVNGMGRSALLSYQGIAKKIHGKDTRAIYVTIEEVGAMQTTDMYKEKELTLDELNELAKTI